MIRRDLRLFIALLTLRETHRAPGIHRSQSVDERRNAQLHLGCAHDSFGRRSSKTTLGAQKGFLYDGANAVQKLSGTTATANMLEGGVDEVFQRTDSGGAMSLLADALGSTVGLADNAGILKTTYSYEPFGNASASGTSTTNSTAYTGRELDASGLYFYRARYYNPQIGRFVSEDPIGFHGGDVSLYRYVWNSPTNFTDPIGEVGIGVSAGGSIEGGLGVVGAGATGSLGDGIFLNGSKVSAGGFASGGAFAGGPGWGASATVTTGRGCGCK